MQIITGYRPDTMYFTANTRLLKNSLVIPKAVLRAQLEKGLSYEEISKVYNNRISVQEIIEQVQRYGISVKSSQSRNLTDNELLNNLIRKLNLKSEDIAKYFKS